MLEDDELHTLVTTHTSENYISSSPGFDTKEKEKGKATHSGYT